MILPASEICVNSAACVPFDWCNRALHWLRPRARHRGESEAPDKLADLAENKPSSSASQPPCHQVPPIAARQLVISTRWHDQVQIMSVPSRHPVVGKIPRLVFCHWSFTTLQVQKPGRSRFDTHESSVTED